MYVKTRSLFTNDSTARQYQTDNLTILNFGILTQLIIIIYNIQESTTKKNAVSLLHKTNSSPIYSRAIKLYVLIYYNLENFP